LVLQYRVTDRVWGPDAARLRHVGNLVRRWGVGHLRDLPWRSSRDPWAVLVVEVTAQQTQLARVIPRWVDFMDRWPTCNDLAISPLDELLVFWKGLGYPRRARNLWLASQRIDLEGWPEGVVGLRTLPGVGEYTATAVAAFAWELDVAVVDTNVGRILARVLGRRLTMAEARSAALVALAGSAWTHNSAMIDIGATLCRPANPTCDGCPLASLCWWANHGRSAPDPAARSAGVSRPQAPFEGSNRQLRGRVLELLGQAPSTEEALLTALAPKAGNAQDHRAPAAIRSLSADGLIEFLAEDRTWRLSAGGTLV
jgi:A/G-specific adenine glycosylase